MKTKSNPDGRYGHIAEPSSERRSTRRALPAETDVVAVLDRLPMAAVLFERRTDGVRLCFGNALARALLAPYSVDGDLGELDPDLRGALETLVLALLEGTVEKLDQRLPIRGQLLRASASPMGLDRVAILLELAEVRRPSDPGSAVWSAISHELRTPLTSLRAALSLLEGEVAGAASGEAAYLLAAASRSTDRLIAFVNQLLERTSGEGSAPELQIRSVDLDRALRRALEPLGPRAASRAVEISLHNELRGALRGDEPRLVHAFFLLIGDALSRTPDNGRLAVRCDRSAPGLVRVSVSEGSSPSGRSTPPGGQLYAADQRARSALDASVVQAIAEAHGGKSGSELVGAAKVSWIELPARVTARSSGEIPRVCLKVAVVTTDEELAAQLTSSLRDQTFEPQVFPTAEAAAFTLGRGVPPAALLFHGSRSDRNAAALLGRVGGSAHTRVPLVVIGPLESVAGCPLPIVAALDVPVDEQRLARVLTWATRRKTLPRALLLGCDPIERELLARRFDQAEAEWIEADSEHEALRVAAHADIDLAVADAAALSHGLNDFLARLRRVSRAPLLVHSASPPSEPAPKARHFLKTREDEALMLEVSEILGQARGRT